MDQKVKTCFVPFVLFMQHWTLSLYLKLPEGDISYRDVRNRPPYIGGGNKKARSHFPNVFSSVFIMYGVVQVYLFLAMMLL